ncbi:hypothetical protein PH213_31990 [Streptomyces sp. SRF1]|uniref:hypothetical protein n=1 Tax=Streptomyces sp. SRF1 TaxID=1549642 RepID=UPI0025AFDDD6|nr:hypothetical protein [Streptomyces sp. SRF1]MDN3059072.1 hypothetical protein [Streptomyces sp. SRF1]
MPHRLGDVAVAVFTADWRGPLDESVADRAAEAAEAAARAGAFVRAEGPGE